MPTVPTVAPRIGELSSDDDYGRMNLLMLRNPTVINALDGCALSLPCEKHGDAPVGFTVAGANGFDWQLLNIAATLESILRA